MIVALFICIIIFLYALWIDIRNNKVLPFMLELNALVYKHNIRCIQENRYDYIINYDHLPSYNKVVFSFKPLTLQAWFSEQQIKELLG